MKNNSKESSIDFKIIDALKAMQTKKRPAFFVSIVKMFLDTSVPMAQQIQASIASRDFNTLAEIAHSLKSSSASLGAIELSKLCHELELSDFSSQNHQSVDLLGKRFTEEFQTVIAELTAMISTD